MPGLAAFTHWVYQFERSDGCEISLGFYIELCLQYQKAPVKAKDYEFKKVRIHQRIRSLP